MHDRDARVGCTTDGKTMCNCEETSWLDNGYHIFFQFLDRLWMDCLRDVTQTIFLSRNIRFTYNNICFFMSLYTDNVYRIKISENICFRISVDR